jgi:hypothetical protein
MTPTPSPHSKNSRPAKKPRFSVFIFGAIGFGFGTILYSVLTVIDAASGNQNSAVVSLGLMLGYLGLAAALLGLHLQEQAAAADKVEREVCHREVIAQLDLLMTTLELNEQAVARTVADALAERAPEPRAWVRRLMFR